LLKSDYSTGAWFFLCRDRSLWFGGALGRISFRVHAQFFIRHLLTFFYGVEKRPGLTARPAKIIPSFIFDLKSVPLFPIQALKKRRLFFEKAAF
jgi:hypothetical protein